MFVSMSELKFFLLMRVLTQNFNIVDLVKFLEKNQKLHIRIVVVTLKLISCKTISKNKIKFENQDSMDKKTSFLAPCPSILGQF
jgi:hypothetical protein